MDRFYLGTHMPSWIGAVDVPLFISHRRLHKRKSFPRASAPWALDSGGFTEISTWGEWLTTPEQYVAAARRYAEGIGEPDFVAPQDWMCEPWIIAKTGLSVAEHQRRTVENYFVLRELAPELPVIPVLQGWTLNDYVWHIAMYEQWQVDLRELPRVGLGSVCRRQDLTAAEDIVLALARYGIKLHGFGMKTTGLQRYGYLLASADSMAWSYNGRKNPGRFHSCALTSCANCPEHALAWRDQVMDGMTYQQLHLGAP